MCRSRIGRGKGRSAGRLTDAIAASIARSAIIGKAPIRGFVTNSVFFPISGCDCTASPRIKEIQDTRKKSSELFNVLSRSDAFFAGISTSSQNRGNRCREIGHLLDASQIRSVSFARSEGAHIVEGV